VRMGSRFFEDAPPAFANHARRRLEQDLVAWLTTVGNDGAPQPNPIWFLWEGETILVYNRPDAHRLAHIHHRPEVAFNFDGNGRGGDIVVITGRAELLDGLPLPHELPAYLAKYSEDMIRVSGSPEAFSRAYPVPLRIHPRRLRGH
jgi:PPOX class probable F420-dependent enzyme